MATSSFDKHFVLDTEDAQRAFLDILNAEHKPFDIDRSLTSPEAMKRGEEELRESLHRLHLL